MTKNSRNVAVIAAAVAVTAGIFGIARKQHPFDLLAGANNSAAVLAPAMTDNQIADEIQRDAKIADLQIRQVGGIVVLRGTANDQEGAAKAVGTIKQLGYSRVANLLTVSPGIDDEGIRRQAERQLATQRGLDGCRFAIRCEKGVLQVSAKVQNDAQEEVARMVLRNVAGAKQVQADFARF